MVIARWKSRIWQKNCVWSLNFSLMQIFEGRINCVNQEEVTFEQRRHRKVVFALKSFFLKAVVVVGNSQMRVEVNSGLNKIVKENKDQEKKNQIWNLKTQSQNVCVSYTTVEWCFTYHSHFETLYTHASNKLAPQNLRSCFTHRARSSHFTLHTRTLKPYSLY